MRHESNETTTSSTTETNSTLSSSVADKDYTICGICRLPLYSNEKGVDDQENGKNDGFVVVTCANYENDSITHNTSCTSIVSPHCHLHCTDVPHRSELYMNRVSRHNPQKQQREVSFTAQENCSHFKYAEDEKDKQSLLYFCPACDIQGTSRYLLEYFENFRRKKVSFYNDEECVRFRDCRQEAFVLDLIETATSQYKQFIQDDTRKNNKKNIMKKTEIHSKALTAIRDRLLRQRYSIKKLQNIQDYEKRSTPLPKIDSIDPTILIGQPIRIYCDISNSYHVGRIIDWRTNTSEANGYTTKEEQSSIYFDKYCPQKKNDNYLDQAHKSLDTHNKYDTCRRLDDKKQEYTKLNLDANVSQTEYLVRFRAGMDGRKLPVHQWLFLEEHPLMVSVALVWAKVIETKKSRSSENHNHLKDTDSQNLNRVLYKPAQLALRSAVEMVPVAEIQNHSDHKSDPKVLALFFGKEFHQSVLRLSSPCFSYNHTKNNISQHLDISAAPSIIDFMNIPREMKIFFREINTRDRTLEFNIALACMEREEQRRIRNWHGLDPFFSIDNS